jgi:hypothetical protein
VQRRAVLDLSRTSGVESSLNPSSATERRAKATLTSWDPPSEINGIEITTRTHLVRSSTVIAAHDLLPEVRVSHPSTYSIEEVL